MQFANTVLNTPPQETSHRVQPGMPPLDLSGRTTSFFEFWPMWLMYIPVVLQWILLAIRYRSLSLPLIANPAISLSGMVGTSKSETFEAAGDKARKWILPWMAYEVSDVDVDTQTTDVLVALRSSGFDLPIVGKPELGCRGVGVKLLKSESELQDYLKSFPSGGGILFQRLSDWHAEAGVFYVRHPGQATGEITSITLKYMPYVVGDGVSTLAELVAQDPRAGELHHLYRNRHADKWQEPVPEGQVFRLIFAASHSRGAIFRDANHLINEQLLKSLDRIFDDIPGFNYGRLDVKFKDVESLQLGQDFEIIEINGASAESINIWDRNAGLWDAISTLLRQYRTLFKLGHANRNQGYTAPGLLALYKAWRHENELVKQYPQND
ncbi:MAG: D-alanine--D-alanine ligase [Gammaproteobacteria bacterium]|nr:D-alanine--D-alanine ligase [Gammaproteobacteria bacterium]